MLHLCLSLHGHHSTALPGLYSIVVMPAIQAGFQGAAPPPPNAVAGLICMKHSHLQTSIALPRLISKVQFI